jgi:hypothetical protein
MKQSETGTEIVASANLARKKGKVHHEGHEAHEGRKRTVKQSGNLKQRIGPDSKDRLRFR